MHAVRRGLALDVTRKPLQPTMQSIRAYQLNLHAMRGREIDIESPIAM